MFRHRFFPLFDPNPDPGAGERTEGPEADPLAHSNDDGKGLQRLIATLSGEGEEEALGAGAEPGSEAGAEPGAKRGDAPAKAAPDARDAEIAALKQALAENNAVLREFTAILRDGPEPKKAQGADAAPAARPDFAAAAKGLAEFLDSGEGDLTPHLAKAIEAGVGQYVSPLLEEIRALREELTETKQAAGGSDALAAAFEAYIGDDPDLAHYKAHKAAIASEMAKIGKERNLPPKALRTGRVVQAAIERLRKSGAFDPPKQLPAPKPKHTAPSAGEGVSGTSRDPIRNGIKGYTVRESKTDPDAIERKFSIRG